MDFGTGFENKKISLSLLMKRRKEKEKEVNLRKFFSDK